MKEALLNFGLSNKEADVYLAHLELGQATVKQIAEKADLKRTSTYTYIRSLINRGLLNTLEKDGKQYFIAEKPEKLKFFCEQQEKEIKRKIKNIESILPELESLYNIASSQSSWMYRPLMYRSPFRLSGSK